MTLCKNDKQITASNSCNYHVHIDNSMFIYWLNIISFLFFSQQQSTSTSTYFLLLRILLNIPFITENTRFRYKYEVKKPDQRIWKSLIPFPALYWTVLLYCIDPQLYYLTVGVVNILSSLVFEVKNTKEDSTTVLQFRATAHHPETFYRLVHFIQSFLEVICSSWHLSRHNRIESFVAVSCNILLNSPLLNTVITSS